jgi:hypothetical protein
MTILSYSQTSYIQLFDNQTHCNTVRQWPFPKFHPKMVVLRDLATDAAAYIYIGILLYEIPNHPRVHTTMQKVC